LWLQVYVGVIFLWRALLTITLRISTPLLVTLMRELREIG